MLCILCQMLLENWEKIGNKIQPLELQYKGGFTVVEKFQCPRKFSCENFPGHGKFDLHYKELSLVKCKRTWADLLIFAEKLVKCKQTCADVLIFAELCRNPATWLADRKMWHGKFLKSWKFSTFALPLLTGKVADKNCQNTLSACVNGKTFTAMEIFQQL